MVSLAIIFILGIANFALHSAVLSNGHQMLEQLPSMIRMLGGRLTLVAEFAVLLAAMLLAGNGWPSLVWVYLGYTALNGLSAWLILTGRI